MTVVLAERRHVTVSALAAGLRRRRGSLRLLGRVALVGGQALALVAVVLAVGYLLLPSAGDARARVDRVLAAHGAARTSAGPRSRALRALVAVEDRRFFAHGAVDPHAVGRAFVSTVTGGGDDAGGSTITQQLAKALYGSNILKSVGMAFKLKRAYSKPAILRMYADVIYFGNGYWGMEQAGRGYFDTPARRLGWAQASLLAGLPQAPSAYDPVEHFARARARQRDVLRALVRTGALTPAGAARAYATPSRPR